MTVTSTLALLFTMLVLALAPSISVLTVCTRAISFGFHHGALTALGILTGDLIFIAIALFGLSYLTEQLNESITWIKLAGAAFILWMGVSLWRAPPAQKNTEVSASHTTLSSFMAGLSMTLVDTKAIAFYIGFFPAFFDVTVLRTSDIAIIFVVTIIAVGGAKLFYAYWSARSGNLIQSKIGDRLNRLTGILLMLIGASIVLSLF